ncbi:hypothetical protein L3V82_06825, partial [Thiotrichales bacterium 19S3-7]|nr:hypothetical protein [Thiotrichales bacterium 19S3-7]MCF6801926.1 hypothetical protein [Thiotrichales bacterium 19S3-11]
LSGRRVASQALERRLIKVDLPPYTATEMQMILKASGFKEAEAIQLITAYEKAKQDNPKLVFRDVMKFAKALIESRQSTTGVKLSTHKTPSVVLDLKVSPAIDNHHPFESLIVDDRSILQPFATIDLALSKHSQIKPNEVVT